VRTIRGLLMAALCAATPAGLAAQQAEVRTRLEARGLPADLVQSVTEVAAAADAQGLPAVAIVDKAIEGWAKRVPAPRVVAAVRQYAARLGEGRDAVGAAGLARPPEAVVIAAAEALGRGIGAEQVGQIVRAAGEPAALAPGLVVAAALAAQGLGGERAVGVVVEAMRAGRPVDELLDLPSVAREMQLRGMNAAEIGRRMMRGGGPGATRPGGAAGGAGPRPPGMPGGLPGQGTKQPGGRRPPGGA